MMMIYSMGYGIACTWIDPCAGGVGDERWTGGNYRNVHMGKGNIVDGWDQIEHDVFGCCIGFGTAAIWGGHRKLMRLEV